MSGSVVKEEEEIGGSKIKEGERKYWKRGRKQRKHERGDGATDRRSE